MQIKSYCFDCGKYKIFHIENWFEDLFSFLPQINIPKKLNLFLDIFLSNIFIVSGLLKYVPIKDLNSLNIPPRIKLFILEAQKNNWEFYIGKSFLGETVNFMVKIQNKKIYFTGLPIADFLNSKISLLDDKDYVKKILKQNNLPIAEGKYFWFWQKKKALNYAKKIGWPVVVKPRTGTFARHITTNILNKDDLLKAILKAREYAPTFIIEKFIDNAFVHRGTVIDFKDVFCVKQIPANVIGDGKSKIKELIELKNKDPMRKDKENKNAVFYKILINKTTDELLKQQGLNYESIPEKGKVVYLQKNPFLRLGGDLEEVTFKMHPDNKELFLKIAKIFNVKVVGIDFIIPDISKSFKEQKCAILELNTSPCIELHYFINSGKPQNIAKSMVDFFKKYYL